jgi:hypothetical protein
MLIEKRLKQCLIRKFRYIVRALQREVEKEKCVGIIEMLTAGIHYGDIVSA